MNIQARQDSSDRFDEITCPNDTLKCFGKSAISNIQTVEFSPQGNLLAVGCRNQTVLILDFVTMAVMRVFALSQDYGQQANDDVDQFFPFWKVANYFDDDFIFRQRPNESTKDCEAFIEAKYAARKAANPSYSVPELMRLEQSAGASTNAAQKGATQTKKDAIASIDWSLDSRRILVCFKQSSSMVVWDVVSCKRVFQLDFSAVAPAVPKVTSAQFDKLNPGFILANGDQALLIKVGDGVHNLDSYEDLRVVMPADFPKATDAEASSKRKGTVKAANQIVTNLFHQGRRFYLLVANASPKQEGKQEEAPRMYYLLDADFKVIHSQKAETQQANSNVVSVSTNEDFTKVLINSSERVMRLYWIDYSAVLQGKGTTAFKLIDGFFDVINHKRWCNQYFLSLPERTKIVSQHPVQSIGESQTMTTATVNNAERFANSTREVFVGSIGEQIADTLKFFNVPDHQFGNAMNYREIQKVELHKKGCTNMSAFSGAHFSIMMVSNNGSLYIWVPRPAKFVQPLSPNFTEIEENVLYVEKEDEFEQEESSDDDTPEEVIGGLGLSLVTSNDGASYDGLLRKMTTKQKKLARTSVDIESVDPMFMARQPQVIAWEHPELVHPGLMFTDDLTTAPKTPGCHPLPFVISSDDSFAAIARRNIEHFRASFDKLIQ